MPSSSPSRTRAIPIVCAQAFGVACGVAGVKVNSHVLPPETLGLYGLFLTFVPIGAWVVHAGLIKFVNRAWADSANRGALFRFSLRLWAQRLPWLALLTVPAAWAIAPEPRAALVVGAVLLASAALLALGALTQNALQAERAHWRDCLVSIIGSASRTFLPPLAYLAAGSVAPALWLGFGGHALLLAGAGLLALSAYWRKGDAGSPAEAPSAAYAGPLFVALAALGWVLAGLNRWLVATFFGETEAGFITLAGGAAIVLTSTLGTVIVQYAQPGWFSLGDHPARHTELAHSVDRLAFLYTAVALAAVTAFALVAPALVGPLIDERYRAALPWIAPSGCFGVATILIAFNHAMLLAGRRESACGSVEIPTAAVLISGGVISAALGRTWFMGWLYLTPALPWLLTLTLARRRLFTPGANPAPGPVR